ncbi:FimV/HubP family polar landmark protein [Pseudomonas anguilliseptica]|uniref:FimV/HubP family polar landmark protein n=1 Tax=Pseudomonas anguilliseptica TaxID=53406 RepID=UPI0022AF5EAF|nr:FimV/HubP family polar landmark protein [Pseudomonas anguilliseptica]MCZ4321805.1 peptidoglycan-binding protein LysM [Pseudomonas anguilliseptica]
MAKVRQLLIGLASSSALYSGLVPALGLGEITLHSALSQPLDAEIELFDVGDLTAEDMRVRLAPAEVFSRSGVDRLYFFNDLRFTPLLRGGKSVIRVMSTQPVREPYLNFIVEVVRPNGQLYREYTVLLDPPSSAAYRSLAAPAASTAPAVVTPAPRVTTAAPVRPAVMPVAQQGNRYSVVSGDSLWKIATRLADDTGQVAPRALMNDIHALNPQAFINGDINRLRAGAQLLLPDSVASVPSAVVEPAVAATVAPETVAVPSAQLPAEQLLQEQARVEQELASQISETLQLQQSLAQLGLQVQQLQEQMAARDQQIAGLQAELAARRASAAASAAAVPAPVAVTAPVAAESGSNWLAIIAGMLALLLAGVAGLFWRSRKPVESAPVAVAAALTPAMPKAPSVTPAVAAAPAAAVALNVREVPRGGPVWPAAGEDALQSANVYIAYGRLNEAASTLRKAWEAQPQRSDIGFRLLEVLALLGDTQGFIAHEALVRASGFTPARIDELKARHAELFSAPPASLLDDVVLELDEVEAQPLVDAANDGQLNLDDMSLDADWDLVSPFAPAAPKKVADKAESSTAGKRKTSDIFELSGSRDARSPFAESMLVEETSSDGWGGDVLDVELLDDFDELASNRENLSKLNMALAYIEQGSLDSACQILNEVINEGDEQQKQEARQLLAKIA